ncbi:hypothetical protein BHM03_00047272 [Ensete ventricosum]|nr:hypothetical protein BHM03_00047272 [Ensete ventricosum]
MGKPSTLHSLQQEEELLLYWSDAIETFPFHREKSNSSNQDKWKVLQQGIKRKKTHLKIFIYCGRGNFSSRRKMFRSQPEKRRTLVLKPIECCCYAAIAPRRSSEETFRSSSSATVVCHSGSFQAMAPTIEEDLDRSDRLQI